MYIDKDSMMTNLNPADIISGALQCSRAYALELMRNQLALIDPALEPVAVVVDTGDIDMNGCHITDIKKVSFLPPGTKLYAAQLAWIPCSERMPKPHQQVLVWEKDSEVETAELMASGEFYVWGWEGEVSPEVTHWMPLPAAPKRIAELEAK